MPAPATPSGVLVAKQLKHLNEIELSRRWGISHRTLQRWRWLKQGPTYLKVGGAIRYRIEDVEAFEAAQLRQMHHAEILGDWR
jgi:Helix-turn-helix domain